MEQLDQMILFAVLAGVGVLVLLLLRRAMREKEAAEWREAVREQAKPDPPPATLAAPAHAPELPAVVISSAAAIPQNESAVDQGKRRTKKKLTPVVATAAEQTPIDSVLGILRKKDGLVAAFLMREIFSPPVSRRK